MSLVIVSRRSWHDQDACDLGEAMKEEGMIFVTGSESPNRIGTSRQWHPAWQALAFCVTMVSKLEIDNHYLRILL